MVAIMNTVNLFKSVKKLFLLFVLMFVYGSAWAAIQITSVVPSQGQPGQTVHVVITGQEFNPYTTFEFGDLDPFISSLVILSATEAAVTIDIPDWIGLGPRDIVARNSDSQATSEFTVVGGFVVSGGPTGTLLKKTGVHIIEGDVFVWGWRGYGLQGNGVKCVASKAVPAKVQSLNNIEQVTGGTHHIVALSDSGNVYGWGYNGHGETGCTTTKGACDSVTTPCNVAVPKAVQVGAGEYFSMALTANGEVYAWGKNCYGQLGRGNTSAKDNGVPQAIDLSGETARLIGAAFYGGFAVTQEGHVWAWGKNLDKGLALPKSHHIYSTPTRVFNLEPYANDIVYIAGGYNWGEALLSDGRVIGWGKLKALGLNDKTCKDTDVPVVIAQDINQLFARYKHSVALANDGTLYTWGEGCYDNIIGGKVPTVRTPAGQPVTSIGGGLEHVFYQTDDGLLFGTGYNGEYKLDQNKCAGEVKWPGSQIVFP